ncbi:MAG TPA: hypothetical protein PK054_04235 [Anaerohalosphaeraceae bacterium]|nr:hypothetical protein [Anaerohalosphaeraceae bacterium]HOL87722.1 hypothetical protein [Anaerohalosphaeraceae bacterium]HPP55771.1 hypothetical protein [Anaerohalosphaeraceae bacterium]
MEYSISIIGLLTAVWGLVVVIQPLWHKTLIGFFARGRRAYAAVVLKIVVGVLFLLYARQCRIPSVIIVLGILTVVGSVLFAAMPITRIHAWFQWCRSRPLWFYRLWAVAAVLLGILILYAGWPVS